MRDSNVEIPTIRLNPIVVSNGLLGSDWIKRLKDRGFIIMPAPTDYPGSSIRGPYTLHLTTVRLEELDDQLVGFDTAQVESYLPRLEHDPIAKVDFGDGF
jgi:hypothetical protein